MIASSQVMQMLKGSLQATWFLSGTEKKGAKVTTLI
jgi:hypothetical protein